MHWTGKFIFLFSSLILAFRVFVVFMLTATLCRDPFTQMEEDRKKKENELAEKKKSFEKVSFPIKYLKLR